MQTRTKAGKTEFLCSLNLAHDKDAWVKPEDMYFRKGKDGATPYRHKACEKIDSVRRHANATKKAAVKITRKATAKKSPAKKAGAK